MQNGVPTEPFSGFPKVFGLLKSGGYGYRFPESVEEHPRYRGSIFGLPYGPPKERTGGSEVNQESREMAIWLRKMIKLYANNPRKRIHYEERLANLQY